MNCLQCGKEVRFIRRAGKKALIVNKTPLYFIPDLTEDMYFIHDGVLRRGRLASDGLTGYTLHNCEGEK